MISEIDRWLAAELYRLYILSQEQIADCLNAQLEAEKAGRDAPLEDIVLKRGYITRKRLAEVLETVPPEVVEAQAGVLRRAAEARLAALSGAEGVEVGPDQGSGYAGMLQVRAGAEPIAAGAVEATRPARKDGAGAAAAGKPAPATASADPAPPAGKARLFEASAGAPIIEDLQLDEILFRSPEITTYSASSAKTEERTLVRLLDPAVARTNADRKADFEREARLQDECSHPNLLKGIGRGVSRGAPYQITEHVDGSPLSKLLEHHVIFDLGRQMRIALQVGVALAYLHEKGLAHTHLHPDHVWLHSDGRVKVAGLEHVAAFDPGNAPDYVAEGFRRFTAREAAIAEFRSYGLLLFHLASSDASVWKTAKAGKLVPYVLEGLRVADDQHHNAPLVLRSIIGRLVSDDPLQYFPHIAPIMKRLQLVHQPLKILVKEAVSFLVEFESKARLRREVARYFPELVGKRSTEKDTSVAVREEAAAEPPAADAPAADGATAEAAAGAEAGAEEAAPAKLRPARLGSRRLRTRLRGRMSPREKLLAGQRRREEAEEESEAAEEAAAGGEAEAEEPRTEPDPATAGMTPEQIAGASTVNEEIEDDEVGADEPEEEEEQAAAKPAAGAKPGAAPADGPEKSEEGEKGVRRVLSRRLARIKGRRKFKR